MPFCVAFAYSRRVSVGVLWLLPIVQRLVVRLGLVTLKVLKV